MLKVNFYIYQDIIQTIKHNNFKRFEEIVKNIFSKKMIIALKTLKKYMKYIFESNITNSLIEGLNNKIKSIKRTALDIQISVILKSTYWFKKVLFQLVLNFLIQLIQ